MCVVRGVCVVCLCNVCVHENSNLTWTRSEKLGNTPTQWDNKQISNKKPKKQSLHESHFHNQILIIFLTLDVKMPSVTRIFSTECHDMLVLTRCCHSDKCEGPLTQKKKSKPLQKRGMVFWTVNFFTTANGTPPNAAADIGDSPGCLPLGALQLEDVCECSDGRGVICKVLRADCQRVRFVNCPRVTSAG